MEEDLMMQFEVEFARVVRLYYSRMQAQLAEVGLYRGQPPIMALLHKRDGMSQKEMARALNLSPATMTVTLKRMERAGLIEREMDGRDQRILRVHLSEEGKRMCEMGERQVGPRRPRSCWTGFPPRSARSLRSTCAASPGTWSAPCARKRPRGRPAVKKNQTI